MKRLLILPFTFGLVLSCGEQTSKDAISELQNDGESLSDIYMTEVKFNDALVSEATLIDLEFYKILDLDEKNVPESQFRAELDSSLGILDKIDLNLSVVDPSFSGGATFLTAMKDLSLKSRTLIQFYIKNVTILSKTENDWTEEELDNFNTDYGTIFDAYSDANDNVIVTQEKFASLNNMELFENTDYDAEAIYNNSTQEETENN